MRWNLALALALTGCADELPPPPDQSAPVSDSQVVDGGSDDSDDEEEAPPADTGPCLSDPGSALQFDGPCPENLLLISVDTWVRDRMGRYSGAADRTDFLDAMLAEGVALDHLRACSNWTFPSMACLLAGASNIEQGFIPTPETAETDRLPDRVELLAEVMVERGYRTALVGSQFLLIEERGLLQGYQDIRVQQPWPADELTAAAAEVAGALVGSGDPWFLHLHLLDPHDPYAPPEAYRAEAEAVTADWASYADIHALEASWADMDEAERALALAVIQALYDGELRFVDDALEQLFVELDALGGLDGALVVFVSDHGEQFFERGEPGHGKDLYGEETLAMGGFWAKNLRPAAVDAPVTHQDLLPTALDALGLPPGDEVTGQIIGAAPADRPVFTAMASWGKVSQTVERSGERLFFRWSNSDTELYLAGDPGERSDRDGEQPETAAALLSLLEPQIQALDALIESSPQEPPPATPR